MTVSIEHCGRIVKRSKNLRGIPEYARISPVARVELIELPESRGSLRVIFQNGAVTRSIFESYSIMCGWVRARRSWNDYKLFVNGEPAK